MGFINIYYEVGKVEDIIFRWYSEGFCVNVLIVDFFCIGLDDKLLNIILKMFLEKMVYVFCNIFMFVRDLVILIKVYYVYYI